MAIVVSKQVEGLHKASGLELLKPQGAQAGGLCSLGTVKTIIMGLKGATNRDISLSWSVWPPSRPFPIGRSFPMPHRPIGLYAMGLPQFKAAGLVKVFDLFCLMKRTRDSPFCKNHDVKSLNIRQNIF